jgi:hypothetical protein
MIRQLKFLQDLSRPLSNKRHDISDGRLGIFGKSGATMGPKDGWVATNHHRYRHAHQLSSNFKVGSVRWYPNFDSNCRKHDLTYWLDQAWVTHSIKRMGHWKMWQARTVAGTVLGRSSPEPHWKSWKVGQHAWQLLSGMRLWWNWTNGARHTTLHTCRKPAASKPWLEQAMPEHNSTHLNKSQDRRSPRAITMDWSVSSKSNDSPTEPSSASKAVTRRHPLIWWSVAPTSRTLFTSGNKTPVTVTS